MIAYSLYVDEVTQMKNPPEELAGGVPPRGYLIYG